MSSKIIPVGFDNITILRGSKYVGVWDWEDCDFEGRTATIKIKNIHPDFKDKKNAWEVGVATVCPLDIDDNPYINRIQIELTKEETFLLSIPEEEEFLYDEEGGYYSVLNIILDDGTVILSANVKVINSLEVETLDYLVDEKDKAVIINEKLDDILLRNDEYISARDNLIDVVIPKAINTYDEKLEAYNLNHAEKVQILEDIATIVGQDKNVVGQDKLDIETMKQNVQDNKDSVSEDRIVVEQLESSVQNLALQVTNNKQAVSLDKQTILNAKTDIEDIRDNLQSSVDSISSKVNISDVQDLLNSTATDKPLSANQGRVLKGFIDNINTVLNSDDTTLDELQEIVNFIKQNKSTLDGLGISNIAGLQSALNAKADKTEVYTKTILDLKISTQQFDKPSRGPLFVKVSPTSIKIPAGLKLTVGAESFKVATDYTLTLASNLLVPETKTAGTDYYVYAKANGTFYISSNKNITTDRLIGGFHYGLVGESEAATGNKTEADMVKIRGINAYSFWDLKYRPVANSEGMVCIGKKWYDIYLLNSEHITNGTSKAGATIAAGAITNGRAIPKIPLEYGGNGTLTYGKFTWFQACEIAKAHGKQLISYAEFPTIAYGVLEGVSSSTNAYEVVAGKIEHYPALTSKYGIEQATGVQWIWDSNLANYPMDTTWAWRDNTDSRGQIYSTEDSPTAVILGGDRISGVIAGSRASRWYNHVWDSYWYIGCRFACDHLELE
ncbi:hypothetical protein N5U36_00585 [Aliarcobacter butzleri]|uniref:phage major tropism determinant n=1 Tax=Aliarcobacter butzleri TaxID=28197 RepID=UPI0021B4CDFD|nr:hypothetical protein [Aliarcobacter butzleri]MCT7633929.1 hypothetical protein [Aliarcobacter butzleri]